MNLIFILVEPLTLLKQPLLTVIFEFPRNIERLNHLSHVAIQQLQSVCDKYIGKNRKE